MSAPVVDDARPEPSDSGSGAEAPLILDTAPPRTLGFRDQAAFWANLGVSLLGFSGALAVLAPQGYPQLSIVAAVVAAIGGTLIGALMVAVAGIPGARSGAPAMTVLRGLFGTKISYVPTLFNIVQCVGWGTFELLVISMGIEAMTDGRGPHWLYIVAAGVVTTGMTLRPLGMLRILRRYVTIAVGIAMLYFSVQLVREGLPPLTEGSWSGFFPAMDAALAVAVSWVPLASDYTRHSRGSKSAFWAALSGYSITSIWCYLLGLVALAQVGGDVDKIFDSFLGVTAGWVFFTVLVVREVDQSFANVYSTAMSIQNLAPRIDRRVLCVGVGALVTAFALMVDDFATYESFLYLLGSVFIPLFGALVVDLFVGRGRTGWDLGDHSPARWVMLAPWALGFGTYQLINPGSIEWWAKGWAHVQDATHIHAQAWTSASLFSFAIAGVTAYAAVLWDRRRARARATG
ncbi:cytosine permease [Streptomyces sp. SID3343]|uniref:purine-cytosine permease family protein n=1 Tax=Streptomyces sp. SID3343 TaxID=2690260 RepID=UPI00136D733C|nr:cytosine permease [Streptomyces sp. SID3343]MYW04626.1 allantoin permease [Streptomyces sp. SID3343]